MARRLRSPWGVRPYWMLTKKAASEKAAKRARDDAMRVQAPLDWGDERRHAVDVDDFFDKPEDDD